MFKFSCFNTHTQSHKQKKMVNLSAEAMRKTIEDSSRNDAQTYLTDANSSNLKVVVDNLKSSVDCPIETGAVEGHSNSDEVESVPDIPVLKIAHIKKSHSLGTGLDMEGRDSGGSASEDGINQNFSSDGSHANCGSHVQNEGKGLVTSLHNQFQDGHPSDSLLVHDDVGNHESVFSIGDAPHSEKDSPANLNDVQFSGEANSGDHTPCTPVFEKSSSLPNIDSPVHLTVCSLRHIRSAEDLSVLDSRRKEMRTHKLASQIIRYPGKDNTLISSYDKDHSSKPVDDSCGNYNYFASAKDWIIPSGDEVNVNDNLGGNSSFYHGAELPSKDFKVKRIEEWVTDLQNFSPLDESDALSPLDDHTYPAKKGVQDVLPATKLEGNKFSPGMEAVKKYISSLSPSATSAQLVNFGLAVIPFLSPLSGLKALNLSGNAIVRIAAGSLPRGLHILNLSKNKISTVEGLRELTRLRVLDLSYNRILRIGHGLASCSSLKEVYLAGNKISEVEGLHRLLKLNVLDLRFNKISTTKCLGQLAANYNSLQAISLEGNPVQKNVGDEQVKKYLQSLLPHLTYFNRQSMKVGTLKDSTDRSARLAIGAHQMDRGIKDLKLMRKATHTSAPSKASPSSSTHGRRSQAAAAAAMAKSSKGRHARLPPPSGTRPGVQPSPLNGPSNPHLSLKSDSSMRRSRSEGTLGAL